MNPLAQRAVVSSDACRSVAPGVVQAFSALLVDGFLAGCAAMVGPLDGRGPGDGGSYGPDARPAIDAIVPNVYDPDAGSLPVVLTQSVDLLLVVDNSGSMTENQMHLMAEFPRVIETLTLPQCTSVANPAIHACVAGLRGERLVLPGVRSLHVGVVSTDLGTPGSVVPGCLNSDSGDDGLLNPIRNGLALRQHEPWTAPASFGRPPSCSDMNEFPSFITFESGTVSPTDFTHDFKCNVGLYIGGCGLEQPLEAAYRAIAWRDASDRAGNTDPNAGFIRYDAVFAIVVLTDEEDGSVRDCRFAEPATPCDDAHSVYDSANARWAAGSNLNLRFYMYPQVCGPQDPTWSLDRYVDPRNAARGFLSVKPGRPESIVFAAIAGVPIPLDGADPDFASDWDSLLGAPGPDRENFCQRNIATAISGTTPEGAFSMVHAKADSACTGTRVVPACRRPRTQPACVSGEQYFAWPSRRVVEVARRFDQSPMCNGGPCHNGIVTSICADDYAPAMRAIAIRVQKRLVQQ